MPNSAYTVDSVDRVPRFLVYNERLHARVRSESVSLLFTTAPGPHGFCVCKKFEHLVLHRRAQLVDERYGPVDSAKGSYVARKW